MIKRKIIVLVGIIFFLFAVPVYAHQMMIAPVESGVIKVGYADGSFSASTEIILYNENNQEISRGSLDEEGYFYYDENSDVVYIVADDGLGHRVQWKVGDPVSYSSNAFKWIKIAIVVSVFIAIAVIFYFKSKKSSKSIPK